MSRVLPFRRKCQCGDTRPFVLSMSIGRETDWLFTDEPKLGACHWRRWYLGNQKDCEIAEGTYAVEPIGSDDKWRHWTFEVDGIFTHAPYAGVQFSARWVISGREVHSAPGKRPYSRKYFRSACSCGRRYPNADLGGFDLIPGEWDTFRCFNCVVAALGLATDPITGRLTAGEINRLPRSLYIRLEKPLTVERKGGAR